MNNPNEKLDPILDLLFRKDFFPVRILAHEKKFPEGISPHSHNGFELRMVIDRKIGRFQRMDLIHPDVCHCNLPEEEWKRAVIFYLQRDGMRITFCGDLLNLHQSPDLPGMIQFLSDDAGDWGEKIRLLDFRLRLALLCLHSRPGGQPQEFGRISWMVNYLQDHYYEHDLSIADLARQTGYSPNYVQQVFRKKTGLTPMEFLSGIRMEAAARFLRERRYLVKEVALLCGFSNAHFFAAAFRRHYHCSPSDFLTEYSGES